MFPALRLSLFKSQREASGGGSVRQVDRISEASWRGGETEHGDQQQEGAKE